MKKLKPEELDKDLIYGKNLSLLPDMKIEFEGKQDPVKLDNPSVRKHYERLLTWLDLQLITKGLLFIRDSDDHTKYDPDFQKLAIVNTWYNMSKTCNDLEDEFLQVNKICVYRVSFSTSFEIPLFLGNLKHCKHIDFF